MEITILNWPKINARADVENPSWFKFKHKFFSDTEFYTFSHAEKLCWLYMLCEASKTNKAGKFTLCTEHCLNNAKIGADVVQTTAKKLQRLQIIEFSTSRRRHVGVTSAGVRQEKKREEKKREEERRGEESCERSDSERLPAAITCYSSLEIVFRQREVSQMIQTRWVAAFPDSEWVVEEINKALAWEESNPTRRKKNFPAFITRWLTKGWDQRKTQSMPVNRAEAVTQQNKAAYAGYLKILEQEERNERQV